MTEEQFILLAIKVLSGNHLPEEEAELHRLMEVSPNFRPVYEGLKTYWQADEYPPIDVDAALVKAWDKIGSVPAAADNLVSMAEAPVVPMRRFWSRRRALGVAIAAAVLVPMAVLTILFLGQKEIAIKWAEKYNPNGVRSMIILPDGTKIWLNADSRLEYPVAFGEHNREIRLSGEAFLDVAKDPSRPFIVRLPEGAVRVLGTSFDIRAYKDEGETRTSVTSGLVAFVGPDSVCLHPNEKAVLDHRTHVVKVSPTDAIADHNWINGILVFNNLSLREIGAALERYFGKEVKFVNDHVARYRYTATFKNNSAEEILTTLKKVKSFHFKITDKFIEIDR